MLKGAAREACSQLRCLRVPGGPPSTRCPSPPSTRCPARRRGRWTSTTLGTDELLLGEALCALLGEQFEAHKVTAEDVRASFDGATLLAAQKAFYEELVGSFRSRGRSDRARAVETQERVELVGPRD